MPKRLVAFKVAMALTIATILLATTTTVDAFATCANTVANDSQDTTCGTREATYYGSFELDAYYKTIYTDPRSRGIINTIWIQTYNAWGDTSDIQMIGPSGNVVWEEEDAIYTGSSRTFWCGPDVVSIRVRISSASFFGNLQPKRGFCELWVR